jgi:hypothetical protein
MKLTSGLLMAVREVTREDVKREFVLRTIYVSSEMQDTSSSSLSNAVAVNTTPERVCWAHRLLVIFATEQTIVRLATGDVGYISTDKAGFGLRL